MFLVLGKKNPKNLLPNDFAKKLLVKNSKIFLEKFEELNQLLIEVEIEVSCEYFEFDELKETKITQHDSPVMHSNG